MLNQTCKNAIKAVVYLSAKSDDGRKTGIKEVAEHIGASAHSVGKILQLLAKEDIINSMKGPTGGFFLNERQQLQPIYNIVLAIEGENVFKECGLGLTKCSETYPCPIHDEYKKIRKQIENLFKDKKVIDLRNKVTDGIAYLIN